MSLRIGELGYHSVVDPKIRYISEVPSAYEHMREQRMRWFRSIYHISSRCRDLIYSNNASLRGKIILPYMLVNSARRAMLVPLIIFGTLECMFGFNPDSPIIWQSIVAVTTGAPAIMAVVASLLNGVPKGILALPEYLIFRVLRAYFTLESMMSILIGHDGEVLEVATKNNVPKLRVFRCRFVTTASYFPRMRRARMRGSTQGKRTTPQRHTLAHVLPSMYELSKQLA